MGVFERARDRLGQNPSPSQRKSFGTHARLFTEAETLRRVVYARRRWGQQVTNGSHGTRLLTTVYCMCVYQTSTLLGVLVFGF